MTVCEGKFQQAAFHHRDVIDLFPEGVSVKFGCAHQASGNLHEVRLPDALDAAVGSTAPAAAPVGNLAVRGPLDLPPAGAAAAAAFDARGEWREPAFTLGHVVSDPFALTVLKLIRPAVLLGGGLPFLRDLGAVVKVEDQNAAVRNIDPLDALGKNLVIELRQAKHLGAALFQNLIRDLLGLAGIAFLHLLPGAAHPCGVHAILLGVGGGELRSVLSGVVHEALSAEATLDLAGEAGDVQALVGKGSELPASGHLVLNVLEGLHVDDWLVGALYKILWELALVLPTLLSDRVLDEFLLQEQVAGVGDVREHALDVGIHPAASVPCGDALGGKLALGLKAGLPIEEVLEDALDDGGFLRDRHQLIVFPPVAVHPEVPIRDAFFKPLLDGPACVLRNAAAFLLCKRSEKAHHQLAVVGQGVNVLLLELYLDTQLLQVPDGLQQVHRVSGESADGLGEDDVDLSGLAVIQQPLKFRPAVDGGTGDEVVGVNTGEFPLWIALDEVISCAENYSNRRITTFIERDCEF